MGATYRLLKILGWAACHMSPDHAQAFGRGLGHFFWTFVPPKRKVLAVNNIIRAGVTNDREKAKEIAKNSSLRFGPLGISMFRFPLLNKDNIQSFVTVKGREKLDRLKEEGKGCILAATHCGNWEVEGAALALYGYPLLSVAMQQKNKDFDKFLCEYRSIPGQTVEYKTGVRDMLRRLKQGYFVGLLCDQDPGDTGILSEFLGQKTLTATGPAHFALLTKLPDPFGKGRKLFHVAEYGIPENGIIFHFIVIFQGSPLPVALGFRNVDGIAAYRKNGGL